MLPHHAEHIIKIDRIIKNTAADLYKLEPDSEEWEEARRDLEVLKQIKIEFYNHIK